jgi:hypothetical protein
VDELEQAGNSTPNTPEEPASSPFREALKREIAAETGEPYEATPENAGDETATQPEEPTGDDTQAETTEGTETEQPPAEGQGAPETVEVEYEGRKFKVAPELKDALLRQSDYTRKTQELAAERQTQAQLKETLTKAFQVTQQLPGLLAELQYTESQIAALQQVDWDTLRATDPLGYTEKRQDALILQQRHQAALANLNQAPQMLQQMEQEQIRAEAQRALPVIKEKIPDWGPERVTKIKSVASEYGFSDAELANLVDPRIVIALNDLVELKTLRSSKEVVQKKLASAHPPAPKPAQGTKRPGQPTLGAYQQARTQLRQSAGMDANEAFVAALRARRAMSKG